VSAASSNPFPMQQGSGSRSRSSSRIPPCKFSDGEMLERMRSEQRGRTMPDWVLRSSWGYPEGLSWEQGLDHPTTSSWLRSNNAVCTKLRLYLGWAKMRKQGKNISAPENQPIAAGTAECIVCTEKSANMVPVTCGHMAMCEECWGKWFQNHKTCPVCKVSLGEVLKVFY
jgi:hypothetical protein